MPVLCGKGEMNKETNSEFYIFALQFTNLAKYSGHAWSLLGANIC